MIDGSSGDTRECQNTADYFFDAGRREELT